MNRYYEQNHSHKGVNSDGSKQIDYSDLTGKPISGSDIAAITEDPTGFTGTPTITHNADDTVTLGGDYKCYYKGARCTRFEGGYTSAAIPATTTTSYFLTFNGDNIQWRDLSSYTDFFQDLLFAFAYYDSAGSAWVVLKETHGLMPWESHREFHNTIGTYVTSAGAITSVVTGSTTAANRRPYIGATTLADEDNLTTNAAITTNSYTIGYNNSTPVFTYTAAQSDIIPLSTANPYYNSFSGTWGQTLFPANSLGTVWLYAVPAALGDSQPYRFIFVQPQWITQAKNSSAGALLTASEVESSRQPSELNLTTFGSLSPEYVPIARFMVVYTGGNWKIYRYDIIEGTKFSTIQTPSGTFQDAEGVPYDNVTSGLTATNVQDAIDEVSASGGYSPTLGSETTAYNGTGLTADTTASFKIELPPQNTVGNFCLVEIAIARPSTRNSNSLVRLISAITGSETGSSAWGLILQMSPGSGNQTRYIFLQPGLYRIFLDVSAAEQHNLTVKYKWVTTDISYT